MRFIRLFHSQLGKCKTALYLVVTEGNKYETSQQKMINFALYRVP
jgi:hypothetical protein